MISLTPFRACLTIRGKGRALSNNIVAMHAQHSQKVRQHSSKPKHHAPSQPPVIQKSSSAAHLSQTTIDSLRLSAPSQQALKTVLGFECLTEVQDATLPVILQGSDVMARAKTGTGKTMGFLIPCVEHLVQKPPMPGKISVLVLSPTRELASQIAKEADALLTYHEFRCQVVYGGTNIKSENRRLHERCDVLVATPGRLIDHLENSGLQNRLSNIQALVLDEADQLLEMGFRPAIEKILRFLPRERQTLLFSATMPQSVKQVAGLALRSDHKFIDTIGEEDTATNVQVEQSYAVVPFESTLHSLYSAVREGSQEPDYKIIVFFVTARLTQFAAAYMQAAGIDVTEIHSRKSQSARDKASTAFRNAKQAILFTSDVSARGVDYPDVTMVIQVGIPSSREQYIHRLGRTARAGKIGTGLIMLAPFEQFFVSKQLQDIPIKPTEINITPNDVSKVQTALQRVDNRVISMAYQAWLGYYNSAKGVFRDKITLVQHANLFSSYCGLPTPPPLLKKTIGMMGLKGVPGLNIDPNNSHHGNRQGGGNQGGSGGNHNNRYNNGRQQTGGEVGNNNNVQQHRPGGGADGGIKQPERSDGYRSNYSQGQNRSRGRPGSAGGEGGRGGGGYGGGSGRGDYKRRRGGGGGGGSGGGRGQRGGE